MADQLNLKTSVTADTSNFTKGMNKAKSDVKDFDRVTKSAMGSVGDAFGVNTGKLEQMSGAIRGLGVKMQETGNGGAKALGSILAKVGPLGAGLAGLGVGALVGSFKLLNSEAQAFQATVNGAGFNQAMTDAIDAYRAAMHDMQSETGRELTEASNKIRGAWAMITQNLKSNATRLITNALGMTDISSEDMRKAEEAASDAAEATQKYSKELYDTQRAIARQSVQWAKMDAQIAEYRLQSKDATLSIAERQDAMARAESLIKQRYEEEYNLRKKAADLQKQMNDLPGTTVAAEDKQLQLETQSFNVLNQKNTLLKGLMREQKSITAEAEKELAARQLLAETLTAGSGVTSGATTEIEANLAPSQASVDSFVSALQLQLGDTTLTVAIEPEEKSLRDFTQEINGLMSGLADSVGQSLGQLVGDLTTGGDAWSNFSNTAMNAFGDLAIQVGRMAVATGAATLGIKAALESLNGGVAIAAGVALIALGSAVKAGMSNIAQGGSAGSSSIASSSNYGGGYYNDFESRDLEVTVTGTLRADGNQLVSVINNTNNRNSYTR